MIVPSPVPTKLTAEASAVPGITRILPIDQGHPATEADETFDFLAPAQAPDELGRLGGYRVLQLLGIGGMGLVFKAEDTQLKRLVALKVMRPAVARKNSGHQRFFREALATAALKSDHIVTIHQVGEACGVPFLAMEFLEGESLEHRLKRGEKLTLAQVFRLGREIAEGLAVAHRGGIIHRDLKPGNIWLEQPSGRAKLLDFGLAWAADSSDVHLTKTGTIIGTPAFMAPEQAKAEKVDPRSDLFSLGCVLYRLCTGQLPFKGKDTMSVLMSLALDHPQPACVVNTEVPLALSFLIDRLLAKEPKDRPRSALAVVEELQALERDFLTAAGHAPLTRRQWRFRLLVAAGILGACGGAILGIMVLNDDFRQPGSCRFACLSDEAGGTLDFLDPSLVRAGDRIDGQPREVVAVLGSHRGWHREGVADTFQLAYRPDGKLLASCGRGTVRLWDGDNLQERAVLHQATWPDGGLAFSPDGQTLATAGEDDVLWLWELAKGAPNKRMACKLKQKASRLAYAPDGQTLACLCVDGTLRLMDMTAPKPTERGLIHHWPVPIKAFAYSPDGKTLAAGDDRGVLHFWDGSAAQPAEVATVMASGEAIRALAWSSDGKTLASATRLLTRVWQVTGTTLKNRGDIPYSREGQAGSAIQGLSLSADGSKLAIGGDFFTQVLDLSQPAPRVLTTIRGQRNVAALAFAPDSKTLATATAQSWESFVRLWDVADQNLRERTIPNGHTDRVLALAFAPDFSVLVSGGDDCTVRVWCKAGNELHELLVLREHKTPVCALAVARRGDFIASVGQDGTVMFWDYSTTMPGLRAVLESDIPGAYAVAFSRDCTALAVGRRGTVEVWDLHPQHPKIKQWLSGHDGKVSSLRFAPDGKTLAACDETKMSLWDLTTAPPSIRMVDQLPERGDVTAIAADCRTVAVSGNAGVISLGELGAGKLVQREVLRGEGNVRAATFAPDGKSVFVGYHSCQVVRWFSASDKRPWQLSMSPFSLAAAPDGRHLAIGNADGTIWVLRVPDERP